MVTRYRLRAVRAHEAALALRLAGAMTAAAAVIALLVHATAAEAARDQLRFSFPGIPNRLGEFASIYLNNLSLLGALLAACFLVRLRRAQTGVSRRERAIMRTWVLACDTAVTVSVVRHVVIVGSAVGAYGERALAALLPHGPVELGSYALGLALYVNAHRGPLTAERCAATSVLAALGLALAAVMEVFF